MYILFIVWTKTTITISLRDSTGDFHAKPVISHTTRPLAIISYTVCDLSSVLTANTYRALERNARPK